MYRQIFCSFLIVLSEEFMGAALYPWQEAEAQYVRQIAFVFELMKEGIESYCGGLSGKTVLEIGTAHQLPHGGLNLALASQCGVKQAFGIDITHPEMTATSPAKVSFWRTAKQVLNVECDGTDDGRVGFWSVDTLHYDEFFQKIVQLQMSASNMFFRDQMFDLVFSNAVLEHVKCPEEVFSEMYRVLKVGGYAYHHWNPFASLEMGGHDIGIPFHFPWAHLRLSPQQHIDKLNEVLIDPDLLMRANSPGHTISKERARELVKDVPLFYRNMMEDLNKVRIREMLDHASRAGLQIVSETCHIHDSARSYLTAEIKAELADYSNEELLCHYHSIVLRRPQ
jgi:SAM-dependent methyltransferase